MGDKNITVTVTYEKVTDTDDTSEEPTEVTPNGPGHAKPDPMFKESENESTSDAERTEEPTYKETVETIFHEVTETNVIYNYELLGKVIVIDTLVCGALILLVIKWKSIKAAVAKKFSNSTEENENDTDKDE